MTICRSCIRRLRHSSRHYSTGRDYNAAVAALNGLQSNFSIVEAIRKQGRGSNKRAIPDMIGWLRRIGYEPSDFDRLNPIHVAGTKGKGSTSSFISSILAQYLPTRRSIPAERLPSKVGLYTSPHLRFVRERIQVNNEPISEDLFAECFWEVWDRFEATRHASSETDPSSIDGKKPLYFHYLTLMALHCYMKENVESAIVECGIGGEYDTTNILVQPSVSGVTSLGIDHEALLGNTVSEIAWHKAGIFKPGVAAFTVPQPEDALRVLHARASERKTKVHEVPVHQAMDSIKLGLQGHFQKLNASLAVAMSAYHLSRLGYGGLPDPYDPTCPLPPEFIKGLEETHLGGRCDMRRDPLDPNVTWYIDGGHTLESIEVAARWFSDRTSRSESEGAIRVLMFNQQKRDASALAKRLHDVLAAALNDSHPFKHAIFCPNTTYKDTGYKADLVSINTNEEDVTSLRVQHELAKTWDGIDSQAKVHVLSTIEDAVAKAREISNGRKVEVLATGSLHLVGGLIEVLENEAEKRGN